MVAKSAMIPLCFNKAKPILHFATPILMPLQRTKQRALA